MKFSDLAHMSAFRLTLLVGIACSSLGCAQNATKFHLPSGSAKPSYSEAVEVKGGGISTLYVSSLVPEVADSSAAKDSRAYFGDTHTQTDGLLKRMKVLLERHGYSMRNVIKVNVFLVADPTKAGVVDSEGFTRAYGKHFGTADVPTLPARTRLTVTGFTNPQALIALDVVAAK